MNDLVVSSLLGIFDPSGTLFAVVGDDGCLYGAGCTALVLLTFFPAFVFPVILSETQVPVSCPSTFGVMWGPILDDLLGADALSAIGAGWADAALGAVAKIVAPNMTTKNASEILARTRLLMRCLSICSLPGPVYVKYNTA